MSYAHQLISGDVLPLVHTNGLYPSGLTTTRKRAEKEPKKDDGFITTYKPYAKSISFRLDAGRSEGQLDVSIVSVCRHNRRVGCRPQCVTGLERMSFVRVPVGESYCLSAIDEVAGCQ